ncbi:DoxX family protein [Sulfurospirillum diekertiae]|uniref:Oxidoreductase CatD n=1 Tax=Sulfurospirillum diekertiae TaxID=1854492 RepID=A0A1Y0HNY0_9BACT|nr:DoxX family protein [Sulfurospirillum diekertiae]ARU49829.1 Putative oxidoreductase CatD [Sulfurospirillum diekertiae]ASC94620.1 Putative oxidoreductase CatD [Sulfurospirillum diekertiae]
MIILEKKLICFVNEDSGKLLLRLSIAILMLFHGFKKFHSGIGGIKALVFNAGLPDFFAYGVYFGEIIIPILLIIGLYTRISAFIFSINMCGAIFLALSDKIFMLDPKTGGLMIELPLLYLLSSFVIVFLGAGKYSIDSKLQHYQK